ncbi:RagB/SusD family nutrient uptake outer membrane protein [Pedobacter deserti]|uniref:RagB/SusD family nutrient uptake outer membrane protein n=1 Tax=Pedobacter deserti TaxID=2817382 RepID=UPI00210B346D|nr:RagB/SusD family nutrient uptake outer membrane protein [Pedobacter sp. SYSU D00382]
MKKSIYTIMMLFAVLVFASCKREEFLDVKPRGIVIPSTLADFRLILDNVVSAAASGSVTSGLSAKHQSTALMTDNTTLTPELTLALFKQDYEVRAYMFEDAIYGPTEDDLDWNRYYQHIYVANVILDGLEDIAGQSAEKSLLEAEARLHRAYAYLHLVNMYAPHYNAATAGSDLGVPIREGIQLSNVDLTRASVQAVYDLVIADLTFGTQNLADKQPGTLQFRPSKAAAFGLLARTYLYQAKYSDALAAAESALKLQGTIRDINTDPMSMFAPGVRVFPNQVNDPEIIWYKDQGGLFLSAVSGELLNLYETGDLRKEWYSTVRNHLILGSNAEGTIYAAQLVANNTSSGVRTSELLLIHAECNARLGKIPEANKDLNELRKKRFKPANYTDINISDPGALLRFVKAERRREMAADAERLFDIKRYNLLDQDGISVTRTYNGKTITVGPTSKKWILPIATKYIQINPEIKPNPRD